MQPISTNKFQETYHLWSKLKTSWMWINVSIVIFYFIVYRILNSDMNIYFD